ncbi:MAG: ABC transporter permease subunit [Bryobacteraceae bacterium]|nr:ABC transporter permease subunit [Bryobacteraceae bacterium]
MRQSKPGLNWWIAVTLGGAAALGPLLLLGLWSVAEGWRWPRLLPEAFTLRAWSFVFSNHSEVAPALWNSTSIGLVVAAVSVVLAFPAARAIALHRFQGRAALFAFLMLPLLTPPLASTMGLHRTMLALGLADTVPGVALAHLVPALPYAILVLTGSFARFDPELELQARTLGATPARVLWSVTLPVIAPGLAAAFLFAFLLSWSQFLTTMLIGGGRVVTVPLQVAAFQRGGDEGIAAALAIVLITPAIGAAVWASRAFHP